MGLPANATRELVEAVKHYPATPRWLDLGADLMLQISEEQLAGVRVVWAQPCGGAWAAAAPGGVALLVDAGDTLSGLDHEAATGPVVATIYGLHLSASSARAARSSSATTRLWPWRWPA